MSDDAIAVVKALERLSDEVRDVRLAIEAFGMQVEVEQSAAPKPCAHPEDSRVSMASAGNEDFFCRACRQHVLRALATVQE